MAQALKDGIREKTLAAALAGFYGKGYGQAAMRSIAGTIRQALFLSILSRTILWTA